MTRIHGRMRPRVVTQDPLSASDADTALDVYAYEDGVVTLLTPSTLNPVTWPSSGAETSRSC